MLHHFNRAADKHKLTFIGFTSQTLDLTTYTFTGVNLGEATNDRVIVVCAYGSAGSARTVNSITLAGNTMTSVVGVTSVNNPSQMSRITSTTGTSATIVVTFSGSVNRCGIAVYSITGYGTVTNHNTASTTGVAATTLSVTLNTPYNGSVIGFYTSFLGTGATSISSTAGFTSTDTNQVVETNQRVFSGSVPRTQSATGATYSVTASGTNGTGSLIVASFS